MSVIVAHSAAATGSPLNKAKPPKHSLNETGKFIILRLTVSPKIFPHCFYQQTARYPKPVKVYRESKTNPVTPTLTLLKWLIECHKNVDPFGSYPVEKAQNVPFTESGKVKLTFL